MRIGITFGILSYVLLLAMLVAFFIGQVDLAGACLLGWFGCWVIFGGIGAVHLMRKAR